MGVWAWKLTVRDVSGAPVIRALAEPMRVPPDDPGGAQAPHQGLAVNRIAGGEAAEDAPDRLILAPPPVALDAIAVAAPTTDDMAEGLPARASAEIQALIAGLLDRAAPSEQDAGAARGGQAIPATVPGVSRSPRPTLRPAAASDATRETAAGPVAGSVRELAARDLPAGAHLVQLGDFDGPDIARAEWDRLAARFPDFLAGRARVIEEARSGQRPLFRLRAHGFDDRAAARRFCAALDARGASCIPVTVR